MAQVCTDVVGEIQQKVVPVTLLPILRGVAVLQHLQTYFAHRCVILSEQATHIAQAACFVQQIEHGLVAAQNLPVAGMDALGAKQQLACAGNLRVFFVIQQAAHNDLDDQVDEERRQVDLPGPNRGQVPSLQRARRQQAVAKGKEVTVVVGHVGIVQCSQRRVCHHCTRLVVQKAMQSDFGIA